MKITILLGSPNRKGSTNILTEAFQRGAEEAGHKCEVIDVCHADIHPCTGCVHCGYEGPCVQKDDMEMIRRKLLQTDMIVFATPLYYYGMSAQMKTVVDRFCFEALSAHYKTLVRYINFEDKGMVLGYGCGTPSMTKRSRYPEEAYRLGKSL